MKKKLGLLTLFLLISFGYISNEARVPDLLANSRDLYAKIKVLTSILETVQRVYVEEKDPDELIEDAIKGVLANLDPHTVYLPADDFKNWNQSFEGYSGIGISFEILDGEITVMSVVHGSPADKVGIRAGDKIVAVDGQRMIGVKRENAAASLHGPVGLPVALKVVSDRWRKPREFQLVRERISLESVPYAMMLQHQIGYIKIDRFTSTTSRELERALKRLERQHMVGLILDLRGNSGGYLNAAVDVADKFIPGGNKIVTTRGRLASSYREYFATDEATHPLYPLVVLLDHGAASASEIVAGAIQDLDRGLIVGKTSFGKGLVQSQYRFHDGSALLITTARYYTPSGRPIQREYRDKTKDEYYRDAYDDSKMRGKEAERGKKYRTLSGRTVYGGGGITPDVWVENDENILSQTLREIYFSEKRYFYTFAERLLKANPAIKTDQQLFLRAFTVSDELYEKFLDFLLKEHPGLSRAKLEIDRADIKFLLKRELAYLAWGTDARFRVNIERDKQLREAIKHLPMANQLLTAVNF